MDSLRDPIVRDLAWAIGSPGLLDETWPAYTGRVVEDVWSVSYTHLTLPTSDLV